MIYLGLNSTTTALTFVHVKPYNDSNLLKMLNVLLWTLTTMIVAGNALTIPNKHEIPKDIPHCHQLALLPQTIELTQMSCWIEANVQAYASNHSVQRDERITVRGPTCSWTSDESEGPGLVDATTLCHTVPNQYSIPPAYGPDFCRCEVWFIGTAAWAACNCDFCQSWTDTSMIGHCTNVKDNCIDRARAYIGSYVTEYPAGAEILYRQNSNVGNPPTYPGAC